MKWSNSIIRNGIRNEGAEVRLVLQNKVQLAVLTAHVRCFLCVTLFVFRFPEHVHESAQVDNTFSSLLIL
jgi:hypothetical protein